MHFKARKESSPTKRQSFASGIFFINSRIFYFSKLKNLPIHLLVMLKNWWKKPALNIGFWAIFFILTLRNESSSCPCQYAIEMLWPADWRLSMKSTETANPAISTGNFRFPYQGSKKPTIFWKKCNGSSLLSSSKFSWISIACKQKKANKKF